MIKKTLFPGLLQWVLILIFVATPLLPAKLLSSSINSPHIRKAMLFWCLWVILGVANILVGLYRSRQMKTRNLNMLYISYLILFFVPVILSGIWSFSAPNMQQSSLTLFALSSIIPLLFNLVWKLVIENVCSEFKWIEMFLLPVISVLVSLIIFEVAVENFFLRDPFYGNIAANSNDRSYWYIMRKIGPNGVNLANSFGFIGAAPDVNYSGLRILLIGDSIPAAGRAVNFPSVAQAAYDEKGVKGQIEIVNASISGYSLEQIKRYYAEKLDGLRHNILIISFYIDDINRDLRYRKNNYLYTPAWPEWMQDVYHHCVLWRLLLNIHGFTEDTFLIYRTRGYNESFPTALKILDEIHEIAKKRGAMVALFNIPRFNWPSVLPAVSHYEFVVMNKRLEEWCRTKGVFYNDVLPIFIGKDIRQFRVSDADIHFNDLGHQMVGIELKHFLDTLMTSESGSVLVAPLP